MENKNQDKSWKVVYEITAMKGEEVLRLEVFDTRDEALDNLFAWALAAKAAGEIKGNTKVYKDKDGVYGYDIKIRGRKELFRTRMEKRVITA